MTKPNKAIFLDRDGTILNERGYLSDPKKMFFYSGVFAALKKLKKAGFKLVIITNQSGVGRGYFTLAQLKKVNTAFRRVLSANGVRLDGIYFCPHLPDAGCSCRKPKIGLIKKAVRDLKIDLKNSYMVGDQIRDVLTAQHARFTGILVLTGSGRQHSRATKKMGTKVSSTLVSAVRWILRHEQ
jgi:D,D-heptose 1,7-bisphosphate phosphatase